MSSPVHAATITRASGNPMTRSVPGRERFVPGLCQRGERARRRREALNLSLDRIAARAGISKSKASEIERGIAVPDEQLMFCFEEAIRIEAVSILKIAAAIITDTDRQVDKEVA